MHYELVICVAGKFVLGVARRAFSFIFPVLFQARIRPGLCKPRVPYYTNNKKPFSLRSMVVSTSKNKNSARVEMLTAMKQPSPRTVCARHSRVRGGVYPLGAVMSSLAMLNLRFDPPLIPFQMGVSTQVYSQCSRP